MSNDPYDMPIDPAYKLFIVVLIGLCILLGYGWYNEHQQHAESVHRLVIEAR